MQTPILSDTLKIVIDAARDAGKAIRDLQSQPLKTRLKSPKEIVTEADDVVNHILRERFIKHFPDWGWLSEESQDDFARLSAQHVWIVDPIDGTRELVANIPEYAISIALVTHGNPVLAVVYNPASEELFYAEKDKGAWCNNERIYCKRGCEGEMTWLASRSEYQRGDFRPFMHDAKIVPIGSIAYKLALVAKGVAHATFSLGNKSEWDVAAGVLLLTEAGGKSNLASYKFNCENVLVDYIVGTSADCWDRVMRFICV